MTNRQATVSQIKRPDGAFSVEWMNHQRPAGLERVNALTFWRTKCSLLLSNVWGKAYRAGHDWVTAFFWHEHDPPRL